MDISMATNGSQSSPSTSRLAHLHDHQDVDTTSSNNVSLSDARIAIKNLDRFAFTGSLSELHQGQDDRARKIQKVSDVIDSISVDQNSKPSRFSRLSGIGQLHREKARQNKRKSLSGRRKDVKSASNSGVNDQRSSTYRPFSLPLLLERLSTYSISTYSNKPTYARLLSPLGMASYGWKHGEGQVRDEVICSTCAAKWKVESPQSSLSKEEQEKQWSEKAKNVVESHEGWCPWRIRSCNTSLYRVPIRSVLETRAEIEIISAKFSTCSGIEMVQLKYEELGEQNAVKLASKFPQYSIIALILALFGWQISGDASVSEVQQCIVTCQMCARRAGLWTYLSNNTNERSEKKFDVLREHKWYCPMINGDVQSGKWMEVDQIITKSTSSAWQLRLQLLLGSESTATNDESSNHLDTRNMRSYEILAKVKAFLDGHSA